ncbi:THAP domain-containing [Paramuricea clavata]|uniref:THAP domain-containing, partial n=1 Tax=Paramuricea clavata TaxID=317549 RepID=A0A6S7GYL9_PARCT|nr:THAP domain-containing [Paramuricea clavata]
MSCVSGLPQCPGLTKETMNVIAEKVSMGDEIIGLEDFGDGEKGTDLASSALVFMACGVLEKWKQPLGHCLIHESGDSDKLKEKLFEAIDKITAIGLTVPAIISDLGSSFIKLARELNITPEKPWFIHNGV